MLENIKIIFGLLVLSTFLFAGEADSFRTYISIENVTEDTSLEVTMPELDGKMSEKPLARQERGKKYEIPYAIAKADRFKFVVQMSKPGHKILPCEFVIEQLRQYDRGYVCTAQGIPSTQVVVRVYTNLHGGDQIKGKQFIARR